MAIYTDQHGDVKVATVVVHILLLALFVIGGLAAGCPVYNVWQQGLQGQAELRRAEQNRQVRVEEARAAAEASKMLAQAEIERARGVAQANEIIGQSLQDNEAYLRYLWVQGLNDGTSEVIYVPTEANLPILEALRRAK